MKLTSTRLHTFATITLIALLTACGGGSSGGDGGDTTGGDTTGGGTGFIPTLTARTNIAAPTGFRIVDATLSPTGDQVAVLFQTTDPNLANSSIFGDAYSLQVFNSVTGNFIRSMDDPGETNIPLDLYWGDDQVSLLLFPGIAGWNAQTGALRQVDTSSGNEDCDLVSPTDAFNAIDNVLYAAGAFNLPEVCVFDFSSFSATKFDLERSASSTRITGMTLTPDNSELIVSFEDDTLRDDSVQNYSAQTLAPVGAAQSGALGEVLSAGDGFGLYLDGLDLILQPTGTIIEGFDTDVAASANGQVMSLHDDGMTRFIALPEVLYIGETALDNDSLRSIAQDGSIAAIVIDRERIEIHNLTNRSSVSAVEPPLTFARQFSGTLNIDGVAEQLTGTCDIEIENTIDFAQVIAEATTTTGATLFIRGAGSTNVSYTYTQGENEFFHSFQLAANVAVEGPVLNTDGTSITGSTLLYTLDPNELFALQVDNSDPTGFATRTLELDAVCTQ